MRYIRVSHCSFRRLLGAQFGNLHDTCNETEWQGWSGGLLFAQDDLVRLTAVITIWYIVKTGSRLFHYCSNHINSFIISCKHHLVLQWSEDCFVISVLSEMSWGGMGWGGVEIDGPSAQRPSSGHALATTEYWNLMRSLVCGC